MSACDGCGRPLQPCPVCAEGICLSCENWQRHHSVRGWLSWHWQRMFCRIRTHRRFP